MEGVGGVSPQAVLSADVIRTVPVATMLALRQTLDVGDPVGLDIAEHIEATQAVM